MTFQPPPGPPSENPPPPPPPPPPGQWGPPPGGQPAFNPQNVNMLDWGILGAGLLAFIFSFVSYYTYSIFSENAWHGFFGWFAMLLALVGTIVVALELFAPQVKFPFSNRLIGLAAYVLATIFVILAGLIDPGGVPSEISLSRGAGYYLSLIVILAGTVLSFMRAQQTGTALPGPLANIPNIGSKGPQGGIGGRHNPPPPPPPGPPTP